LNSKISTSSNDTFGLALGEPEELAEVEELDLVEELIFLFLFFVFVLL
jgi:hypothetical protein